MAGDSQADAGSALKDENPDKTAALVSKDLEPLSPARDSAETLYSTG